MRKLILLLVTLSVVLGCITQKKFSGNQGIIGEVCWVEGNLMPSVDDTTYAARVKGMPVKRKVYIYQATRRDEAVSVNGVFFKISRSELIGRVKSKSNGKFKVKLPPGKYSLFVMEEEGLFANSFDGDNYINPVTVHANKYAEVQILVNYKAYY